MGEPPHADVSLANQKLLLDLREANEKLIGLSIQAQELTEQAEEGKARAERSEHELRVIAEFRELFIGIVSHDLRNPIGAIMLCCDQLVRRGKLDDVDAKLVERIVSSSQRMARMIRQLLDLTRVRLGAGIPLELKPADLGQICQEIALEFEARAPVRIEIHGDVTGTWDSDRLAEVLSNLIGNAVDHGAKDAAIRVAVRGEELEVVVEVANPGEPIPEAILSVLFEPFRQGRPAKKTAAGNLGLGLYIARQVVLAHGGTLTARSADGTTTFTIRLPRLPPEARPAG